MVLRNLSGGGIVLGLPLQNGEFLVNLRQFLILLIIDFFLGVSLLQHMREGFLVDLRDGCLDHCPLLLEFLQSRLGLLLQLDLLLPELHLLLDKLLDFGVGLLEGELRLDFRADFLDLSVVALHLDEVLLHCLLLLRQQLLLLFDLLLHRLQVAQLDLQGLQLRFVFVVLDLEVFQLFVLCGLFGSSWRGSLFWSLGSGEANLG